MAFAVLRPLIAQEYLYQKNGTLCLAGARIQELPGTAPLGRSAFDRALALLRHRHEVLSTVIRGDNHVKVDGMQLPFDWNECQDDRGFDAFLDQEVLRPLDATEAVFRLSVQSYQSTRAYDCVVTGHHSFLDGDATATVFFELLHYLSAPTDFADLPPLAPVDIMAHIPSGCDALPLPSPVSDPVRLVTPPMDPAPPGRQNTYADFTPEESAVLLRNCKQEGVTITALLNAALILATASSAILRGDANLPPRLHVVGGTTVNWRKYMPTLPPVDVAGRPNPTKTHLCVASGGLGVEYDIDRRATTTLWDMARTARDNLREVMSRHEGRGIFINFSCFRAGSFPPTAVYLSSLGELPLKAVYPALPDRPPRFGVSGFRLTVGGDRVPVPVPLLVAYTSLGHLSLVMTTSRPPWTAEAVARLLRQVVGLLRLSTAPESRSLGLVDLWDRIRAFE
ncbi:hypothetical protein PAPYR_10476 [Paratrimastix pyriformis]|uniref:Condensation domain-containing protein n=1 Tax=Paratrimastix pyriformis TaxID=342808 RepID=A0ABQ8U7P5_9EUKA|nr:hypothetical protein PAPYR_10476 [Paratrimastix pyriformis]